MESLRPRIAVLLLLFALLAAAEFHEAHANPETPASRWLEKVTKRKTGRHSGCSARPWVCHRGAFPQPFAKKTTCCRNRCVDVSSDENNCGLCGVRCPFSWRCCNGKCVDPKSNPLHCGGCNNRCAAGSRCSHGMCGYAQHYQPLPHRTAPPRRVHSRHRHHRRHHHYRP
ncbi:unnamed protein product [Spirodela intermedia]|uniref:Uncharacterized protein n=1 Tax=Spirodela intermedia TaxID=51605 RepID=A0A7I8JU80_SPIIN|nr:unnamed protein product [Spirodela intermedia]CAA6673315.1 unnamed protein product [Spirodela intermedia]